MLRFDESPKSTTQHPIQLTSNCQYLSHWKASGIAVDSNLTSALHACHERLAGSAKSLRIKSPCCA